MIINEAERKFREIQQSNQDISILLEEKEIMIRNLIINLNQKKIEAKKKEEITSAKIVSVVSQCKESMTKVISKSKASLDVLKLEDKKLQKENLILQASNKKKKKKINKLQWGLKELGESEIPHNKNVEILQSTLQIK